MEKTMRTTLLLSALGLVVSTAAFSQDWGGYSKELGGGAPVTAPYSSFGPGHSNSYGYADRFSRGDGSNLPTPRAVARDRGANPGREAPIALQPMTNPTWLLGIN
jgi:hypothetical protein